MQLLKLSLLTVLAALVVPAFSLSPKPLKQTTRREVVERQQRRQSNPIRPRQSATVCNIPSGEPGGFYTEFSANFGVFGYELYGYGSGVIEDLNNPGNTNPAYPPVSTNLGYISNVDGAQLSCAYQTASVGYNSFDLHFLRSECAWICVQYHGQNFDTSYFNQDNDDVVIVIGYSNED